MARAKKPAKKAFTVCGPHIVAGVEPGGSLELVDDDHAAYLVAAGHITSETKKESE